MSDLFHSGTRGNLKSTITCNVKGLRRIQNDAHGVKGTRGKGEGLSSLGMMDSDWAKRANDTAHPESSSVLKVS